MQKRVLAIAILALLLVWEGPISSVSSSEVETYSFETEVSKMLEIIINSLYTKKNIFLRELISNASDALDRIRFTLLTDKEAASPLEDKAQQLEIKISADSTDNTITFVDTGCGMSHDDLKNNLGTLARSGTKRFLEAADKAQDEKEDDSSDSMNLIGQFGVGFYSVFLVADHVHVYSKAPNDEQHIWHSYANGTFTLEKDPQGNTLGRGTKIVMHLKRDALEFLREDSLKDLIKTYSEFIHFPIYLNTSKEIEEEVPVEEEETESTPEEEKKEETTEEEKKEEEEKLEDETEEKEEEAEVKEEEKKEGEEEKPKTKKEKRTIYEWTLINENKPIWLRSPKSVGKEEYHKFYKAITKEYEDPLTFSHFLAEGDVIFKSILFVPSRAPYDMFSPTSTSNSIKLYVRRVFITDDFKELMPRYLSFVKGVVDSDDLPLHVSREQLQESELIKIIKRKLVKKTLSLFKDIADEDERMATADEDDSEDEKKAKEEYKPKYPKFWEEYGKALRLGVIDDSLNRLKISKLLRFKTSTSGDDVRSLEQYVSSMKSNQKLIYFLAAETEDHILQSPFLETAKNLGYEVLFFTDAIDEYVAQHLPEFDGKKFQNLAQEGLYLGDEDEETKTAFKEQQEKFDSLTSWIKTTLDKKVEKVILAKNLVDTPCVLTSPQYGTSANMERIMRSQALGADARMAPPKARKIMEVNPNHPIVKELRNRVDTNDEAAAKDIAELMYDTALLQSGWPVDDTRAFANRVHKMMKLGLSLDLESHDEAPKTPEDKPAEEETKSDEL